MKKLSQTKKAINWVAESPFIRTDAEAARKFKLASSSSLCAYRKQHKIGRETPAKCV